MRYRTTLVAFTPPAAEIIAHSRSGEREREVVIDALMDTAC